MDVYKELCDLKDTIANEITQANKEIKKSGGDLNSGDIEMIDKLTHSMKSLITACAMLEAEDGYSGEYSRDDGYSRRYSRAYRNSYGRDERTGGGSYGSYAKNGYSREGRNGYSRMDWNEHLQMMMDEAPDEQTRMDIKRLMDRTRN